MAAMIWSRPVMAVVLASGGLVAASGVGGHAVPGPTAPRMAVVVECPEGDVALPLDMEYYERTEELNGDVDVDMMTLAGTLPAGTCVRANGEKEGGERAKTEKENQKRTEKD